LRKNEEKYRCLSQEFQVLLNGMPDIISLISPDFKIVWCNKLSAVIFNKKIPDMIGQYCYQIRHNRAGLCEDCPVQRSLRSKQIEFGEVFSPDGDLWEMRAIPVFNEQGEIKGVIEQCRNITEKKKAEMSLRESEERFRVMFERAGIGIALVDSTGHPQKINPGLQNMLGYSADELAKMHFTELVHPDDAEGDLNLFMELIAGKRDAYRREERLIDKDGRGIWIDLTVTSQRGPKGELERVIAMMVDITERKEAEKALQRSEDQARGLAHENAIIAEIGRIISSTLDIEEVYGRFAEEVKKLIPFDRIVISTLDLKHQRVTIAYVSGHDIPDRRQGDHIPLAGTISEKLIRMRSSILMQTEKEEEWGECFPALLSTFQLGIRSMLAVPLFSKDQLIGALHLQSLTPKAYTEPDLQVAERVGNQIAGAIANAQLFAQHERSEAEKANLQAQLQQSQKMEAIGKLAGGVAHDFNNLLTVISIQSQLSLLGLREGDPLRENLQEIEKAADRAANLTRQLLAFGRRQILEMKVLNLNFIVSDLEKMLHRVIGEDIELKTILADDLGMVKVDPGQIEQVIVNLAVNAKDAMPHGGNLTLETANVELDEEYAGPHIAVIPSLYVMLAISDTGVGMSKEVREQIFDPFFTTKGKGKGTGLGLSTVYGIVKQSGGSIWVYSEVGHGTTFKIYLPQVFATADELTKEKTREEVPRGEETILVVEDDGMVRKMTIDILRKQGYTVLEAEAGGEALLIFEQYKDPIHLILTDVVMPHMSGPEFIERLRQVREDFKVLFMTGYAENEIIHQGVLEEGVNLIHKPFTFEKLARKVREVLEENSESSV
ncbi:MAG TPA: PAS domain S-box protein, partial [Thermodesulfobacteriota bacterium]|nr:PAS domain S-box protein [Thermodesulfobacteriota bacterium]